MSTKLPILIVFFCLLLIGADSFGQAESYYSGGYKIDYFNHKDGLSNWEIADIIQDRKGNLWMSSIDQLVKYDGYEFQNYKPVPDSMITGSQNILWKLNEDQSGNIWASTFGGGLLKFNPTTEQFKRYLLIGKDTLNLRNNAIHNFQVIDSTKIIAGSIKKFFQFDLVENKSTIREGLGVKDRMGNFSKVFKDAQGILWLIGDHQLERINKLGDSITDSLSSIQSFIHLIQPDSTKKTPILWLAESKKGGYWVIYREPTKEGGFKSAIGLLEPDSNKFSRINIDPLDYFFNMAIEGPNGSLWLGTWGNGLYKLDINNKNFKDGTMIDLELINLIKNEHGDFYYIRGLLADNFGNIWVGTRQQRLFKIDLVSTSKLKYLELSMDSLNFQNNLFGLMEDHQGNIWSGLENGKIIKVDSNFNKLEIIEPTLENGFSTHPLKQINEHLWFSGGEKGNSLVRTNLNNEVIDIYTLPDSLIVGEYNFTGLAKGNGDFLWLIYGAGQIFKFDLTTEKFSFHYGNKYYGGSSIVSIFANEEKIYYGTGQGRIGHIDSINENKHEEIVDFKFPLSDFFISKNGNLWATSTFGLSMFDMETGSIKKFDKKDNFGSKTYASLIEDVEGKIWLFSEEGIKIFDSNNESFSSFSALSNVEPSPYIGNTVLYNQKNQIVFLGKKGIYAFDPSKIKIDSITPNLTLSKFWINNTTLKDVNQEQAVEFSLGNPLSLAYDNNDIDIQYTGIDYRNQKITYAYQLEGYQKEWQQVGTQRIARFPNLPPGSYNFKVKAANADGIWSEPISQKITILPPWWQTWWAYLLYAFSAIGALAYWWRNMQLKIKRKEAQLQKEKAHSQELESLNAANQRFVPQDFLAILGKNSIKDLQLGDQTETKMTILFSDIRAYTTLSETMTPQENFKFINGYLGRMGPIIKQYGGFISQYYGDGLMALFLNDHSAAIKAALEMQAIQNQYNQERMAKGRQPIRTGIGLNTGSLMLGVIGDENRYDSTVISDAVNTASRMEGLTKTFGASVIVSEKTLQEVLKAGASSKTIASSGNFTYRYLGKVKVKGKNLALSIYDFYGGDTAAIQLLKNQTKVKFEQGMHHYFNRQFGKAAEAFKQVLATDSTDKAAQYYLDKAVTFIIDGVAEHWNGVEEMVAK